MRIVFDIEADGLLISATTVWCVATLNVDTKERKFFGPDQLKEAMMELANADVLIGHNIVGYDLPLLDKLLGWRPFSHQEIIDTLVLSRLAKSDRARPLGTNAGPHSLEAWGYRVGHGKPEHSDWTQFSPAMRIRCVEDTVINELMYWQLSAEMDALGIRWDDCSYIEHIMAHIMMEQEENGVPLDVEQVRRLHLAVDTEVVQIDSDVVPLCPDVPLSASRQPSWPEKQFKKDGSPTVAARRYYGEEFKTYRTDKIVRKETMNLGSEKQVKVYLLDLGWVPTEWNYKKVKGREIRDENGNKIKTSPRLTEDSLTSVKWKKGEEFIGTSIVKRLMLSHRRGMLEGWLRNVRPDGRITASAVPCGTPTGRMTHRIVVNVPGVNSPLGKEMRSCFTSAPGYTRLGIDLASCQLRGLCHYMGDEEYQRQVVEGDAHQYMADLAGLPDRQAGKKLNYTTLFGAGIDKIATDLGMTKTEARRVKKTMFLNLPKLKELIDNLSREWKEKGYVLGVDGRPLWVRAEHMLLVYLMQGLEAVVIKNFMALIHTQRQLLNYQLITTMHDEVQYLVWDEDVVEFKQYAHSAIEMVNDKFNLQCPQAIDIKEGETWAQCH